MTPRAPGRIGLFGVLGAGNLGNDGSMEAVLRHLRLAYPHLSVDAIGVEPEVLRARYGLRADPLHRMRWRGRSKRRSVVLTAVMVGAQTITDGWGIARWVACHDVVIVPGMGALESSLPVRPWQAPWCMFMMSAAGRARGVTTAFVATGATPVGSPATRWLLTTSARWATSRSFRDEASRSHLERSGVDVAQDLVLPDLVHALPTPALVAPDAGLIGVGVMDWWGSAEDREVAAELHDRYERELRRFVRWLVDHGYRVRLLTSDDDDVPLARRMMEDFRRTRGLRSTGDAVMYDRPRDIEELMRQVAGTQAVVASRFHVVLSGLKCARPTLALAYSGKHVALLDQFGCPEASLSAYEADCEKIVHAFEELVSHESSLSARLGNRSRELAASAERSLGLVLAGLLGRYEPDPGTSLAQESLTSSP